MSLSLITQRRSLLLLVLIFCTTWVIAFSPASTLRVTDGDIKQCLHVQQLDALKTDIEGGESPIMRKVFTWLFPFGPAWNSILGTFYISSVPNFILAFIPAKISGDTLNTMTAFATGGLLSDVFLHLVPHSFHGEHQDSGVHFIMVEEKRNILTGLGIFLGFAAFFFMEKTVRVLGGDGDGTTAHSHSHSHSIDDGAMTTGRSIATSEGTLKSRAKVESTSSPSYLESSNTESTNSVTNGPSKLSAYLNLFGDFVHNITDGLATFIGIAVRNATASSVDTSRTVDFAGGIRQDANGLLGTTLQIADLVIPFVAGGFLYIASVAVLPTLLADSKSGKQALREFVAMFFGVACMFLVAWNE
ncbi:ZIP-like iron-zinc transporter [Lentinula edodes]|uniref:ZIP-like iron-zinc transporter n=1 Tax=Lentinula edodes TaxID=5353 RepID=A0A1Q3DZ43_LENED|nr:ZIP-like iron-zinc transporter [Lentinula edodes]